MCFRMNLDWKYRIIFLFKITTQSSIDSSILILKKFESFILLNLKKKEEKIFLDGPVFVRDSFRISRFL